MKKAITAIKLLRPAILFMVQALMLAIISAGASPLTLIVHVDQPGAKINPAMSAVESKCATRGHFKVYHLGQA